MRPHPAPTGSVGAPARPSLWRFEAGAWLFIRLVLGVSWVRAGWEKLDDPGWTAEPRGKAISGFLQGAIAKSTAGPHPEVPHWYHTLVQEVFLPNATLLAVLVTYGELLVGIALIVGLLTRFSALAGVTMNLAFVWAGTTSTNPPMLLLGLALAFFGHHAGRFGLDGWGVPWAAARLPGQVKRLGHEMLFVLALLAAAALALAVSGAETWAAMAVLALIVTTGATWRHNAS